MNKTICRQTVTPTRNTLTDYFTGWGAALVDDAGWFNSGQISVSPSGTEWYRVTASAISTGTNIQTTSELRLRIATLTLPGTPVRTDSYLFQAHQSGIVRPAISVSGLVPASVNATDMGFAFYYGDTTADRQWTFELQVEQA